MRRRNTSASAARPATATSSAANRCVAGFYTSGVSKVIQVGEPAAALEGVAGLRNDATNETTRCPAAVRAAAAIGEGRAADRIVLVRAVEVLNDSCGDLARQADGARLIGREFAAPCEVDVRRSCVVSQGDARVETADCLSAPAAWLDRAKAPGFATRAVCGTHVLLQKTHKVVQTGALRRRARSCRRRRAALPHRRGGQVVVVHFACGGAGVYDECAGGANRMSRTTPLGADASRPRTRPASA